MVENCVHLNINDEILGDVDSSFELVRVGAVRGCGMGMTLISCSLVGLSLGLLLKTSGTHLLSSTIIVGAGLSRKFAPWLPINLYIL